MEVTILGSGSGIPTRARYAAGILINVENENLLFDTGPGILKKLLEKSITYHDINYIFYTHFHTDHTLDAAAILFAAKYALSLRTKKLNIIGPEGLEDFYNRLLNLYGDVIKPQGYEVALREIEEQTLDFGAYKIKTLKMQHTPESLGYRVEAKDKAVVYSGDTDVCENLLKLGKDCDVLILDCSFPQEMKVKGHLTAREAGQIAQECSCKKLVLSHLYPVCQQDEIKRQASGVFKGEVTVAYDLMNITL